MYIILYPHLSALSRQIIFALIFVSISASQVFSEQQYRANLAGPTVVAPGGLSEKERAALQRQYRYQVRRKDALAYPSAATSMLPREERVESEVEEYNRYLGTAVELYRAGEFEEAVRVFRYLAEIDPGDEYVRSYLSRARREMASQKASWKKRAETDAASLRRDKIDNLIRDGIEAYKNKDFDSALLDFQGVISIDPKNGTANRYLKKLDGFYSKKMEAKDAVRAWDSRNSAKGSVEDEMLDEAESRKASEHGEVDRYLKDAELKLFVDKIVESKNAEKERLNQVILGPGDELDILVVNHPELSGKVVIQPTGEVLFPFGEVAVGAGLTIDELSEKARILLDEYVENPSVFISLLSSRSQIFYVIDEISCTPYPITKPDMTLRDALFLSDWGNNRALGRVIVMKPSALHPVIKKVDAFNLIYRADLRDNIRISSGDVIYVPMTLAAKTTKVLFDTLAPFRAVRAARDDYLDLKWNEWDYKDYFRMPQTPQDMSPSAGGAGGYDNFDYYYMLGSTNNY